MFRVTFRALLGIAFALAWLGSADAQVRQTEDGPVRGRTAGGVSQFRAIPYATPPLGTLRWRAPRRAKPWTGTLDGREYGPACQQSLSAYPVSEDCLTLNVFVPAAATDTSKLPVMVWIHGGGLISGAARDFDGSALARRENAVIVTINYRLGYLGFLAHPALSAEDPRHVSGNYGLLDQQAAFGWVRRNIANFGGDPARLTIFGESAGGQSVIDQLISPSAGPLYSAIAQSGAYMTNLPTLPQAEKDGKAAAAKLGCKNQLAACLHYLSAKTIADALNPLSSLGSVSAVVDGLVIPLPPAQAFAAGRFQRVPVINGSNHDEIRLFTGLAQGLSGAKPMTADGYTAAIQARFGTMAPTVLKAYPVGDYAIPDYAYDAVSTDIAFSCNTHLLNAQLARYTKVFQYELNDPHAFVASGPVVEGFDYGSPHSADLSYLFPKYNVAFFHPDGPGPFTPGQVKLRNAIQDYWGAMATKGDPSTPSPAPWPRFALAKPQVLSLVPPNAVLRSDFFTDHHCALWKATLLKQAGLPKGAAY